MDSALNRKQNLRAIDLYSGIGGWSLGLAMAGIDVVASYEWWGKAARTNEKNNGHVSREVDIRQLQLEDLPRNIDIVVGSPPCTQFSFANRGGGGNIEDGLRDVEKFLQIVDFLKPKFWAMENVPRTADIIRERLKGGGTLEHFSKLAPNIVVVDMADWGLPQARKRCIVGNFDVGLLFKYRDLAKPRHLRDVVEALNRSTIFDPIYGTRISRHQVTDHLVEDYLSMEEERLNREMKTFHPVYNNMNFPDLLDRPARTITATCTRVSRESVVIEDAEAHGRYRRLTVRERGCLQGFPVTYQFYGDSYAQKLKMIGNAVPPLMTFFIAQSMLETPPRDVPALKDVVGAFTPPTETPARTLPDKPGSVYPPTRRFRLAIPGLRFKSGVRFELANEITPNEVNWRVGFYFGDSKNIERRELNREMLDAIRSLEALRTSQKQISAVQEAIRHSLFKTSSLELQSVWTHATRKGTHPFDVVDLLGRHASELELVFDANGVCATDALATLFDQRQRGLPKVFRHAKSVLAGLVVGSAANAVLQDEIFLSLGQARKLHAH